MAVDELDVRQVPKPQRHPLIFERFSELDLGSAFVLINNHDPKHLRDEFERDHPGAYTWHYVESGPTWRIRIGKLTKTARPRVLTNANAIIADAVTADAAGAVWKLDVRERHLDSNIIRLHPGQRIDSHIGPDLDVLLFVVAGAGELVSEPDSLTEALAAGDVVWLPRRSERSIAAGPSGLTYLTVHPRRPALRIDAISVQ